MTPTVSHVASSVEVSQKRQQFAVSSASCTWIPISLLTLPPYPAYKHPVCAWCTPCVPHASNALCTPLKRPGSALCAPLISSYTIRTDPTRRAHASHALHVPHIRSLKGLSSCACVRGLVPASLRVVRWHLPIHPLSRLVARCSLPTARHSRCPPVTSHHLAVGTTVSHSSVIRYA